jgi:hypothetical protein
VNMREDMVLHKKTFMKNLSGGVCASLGVGDLFSNASNQEQGNIKC